MIYDTLDIIPAKLFFRIEQTGEFNLLSSKKTKKDLSVLWKFLEEQHQLLNQNKKGNKIVLIGAKIESLHAKFKATELSIYHLRNKRDTEVIDLLKGYGYTLHLNKFDKHLDIIEKENKALIIKINNLKNELPKETENTDKTTFDEVILSYGSLTNSGFIDTNKITITQYYALINLGNKKIKQLDKNG